MKHCGLILLLFSSLSLAQTYKWTDENGNVHYSDKPSEATKTAPRLNESHTVQKQTQRLQANERSVVSPSQFPTPTPAPAPPPGNYSPPPLRPGVTSEHLAQAQKNMQVVPENGIDERTLMNFYKQIIQSCKNNQANTLWSMFSVIKKEPFILNKSPAEQTKLFNMYCQSFLQTDQELGGNPANGKHSVKQDGKFTSNGLPISYWYIHTGAGKLVWRLKIIFENGQLKINDH